jgi:hypothetical protein
MRRSLLNIGTAWVILAALPGYATAQTFTLAESVSRDAAAGARLDVAPAAVARASEQRPGTGAPIEPDVTPGGSRGLLIPLYFSSAALQMMDVHSTRRAISAGHAEGNPFMAGLASNTTAFVAVKAATATGVIFVSERLRKRNRAAAIGLMVAINVATAAIVAHNYRLPR